MQKVTSVLPSWDKTKTTSKKGLDKVWGWADKLGAPVNRLSNRIGSEAFWPTTLDKESDKAARILRSFCKDGFYAPNDDPTKEGGPTAKQRVLKKIPAKVIQNAVGLAIFTTMRTGLWISGAGGSGVLVARMEDGSWSCPSGILLHTAGLGFLVGVDIYDCVVVINNRKALESFTKVRATLGGEISAVAGPVGVGGVLENDGKWKQVNRPVFTYLKSRGFYAGVQVDGTIIIERTDENERFYHQKIPVADILAGKVRHPPHEIKMLMETIKAAEGRDDFDHELMEELEDQPAPGDVDIESPSDRNGQIFGIPEPDDPDPFGVLALEKIGLEIREAGTRSRPPSSQFEYKPSPTSPIYSHFHRRSVDTMQGSNRGSYMSNKTATSFDRTTQTIDMATQTDVDGMNSPGLSPGFGKQSKIITAREPEDIDYTKVDLGPYSNISESENGDFIGNGKRNGLHNPNENSSRSSEHDTSYTSEEEDDEEPVIYEAASTAPSRGAILTPKINLVNAKGSLVNIPKRVPPPLPPRSPMRSSQTFEPLSIGSLTPSPTKNGFEEVDLNESKSEVETVPIIETQAATPGTDANTQTDADNKTDVDAQNEVDTKTDVDTQDEVDAQTGDQSVEPPKISVVEDESLKTPTKMTHSETESDTVEGDTRTSTDHVSNHSGMSKTDGESFHSLPATPVEVAH